MGYRTSGGEGGSVASCSVLALVLMLVPGLMPGLGLGLALACTDGGGEDVRMRGCEEGWGGLARAGPRRSSSVSRDTCDSCTGSRLGNAIGRGSQR